jgi:hypothetical protein
MCEIIPNPHRIKVLTSGCPENQKINVDISSDLVFLLVWNNNKINKVKSKVIPVTGRRGSQYCETSMLPYFMDNRLAVGGDCAGEEQQQQ